MKSDICQFLLNERHYVMVLILEREVTEFFKLFCGLTRKCLIQGSLGVI